MKDTLKKLCYFAYSSFLYDKNLYKNNYIWLELLVQPFLSVLFFTLISISIRGINNSYRYMLFNIVLVSFNMTFIGSSIEFMRDKYLGVLKFIEGSPINSFFVFFSKSLYKLLLSIIIFILLYSSMNLILYKTLNIGFFLIILLVLIIILISSSIFGLLIGCIGLWVKDVNILLNLVSSVLMLLCGINFPVTVLPIPLQCFSRILPLSNGILSLQFLIEKNLNKSIYYILFEFLVAVIYLIILRFVYARMQNIAIKNGTLDLL